MAASTCVKCGSHSFEMVENTPRDSKFKMMFVQCSSCGGVIGVVDFYNVPSLIEKIGKKIGVDIFRG